MKVADLKENTSEKKVAVSCPVNFSKLTLGALRKYQYKFRLQMGKKEKPLLTREDLIAAIEHHFVLEMKVDQHEEIAKFLSLKREEARADMPLHGVRPRPPRGRANRPTRQNVNNAIVGSGSLISAVKDQANGQNDSKDSAVAHKTRTGVAMANNLSQAGSTTATTATGGKRAGSAANTQSTASAAPQTESK